MTDDVVMPELSERDARLMRDFSDLVGPTPPGGRPSPLAWGLAVGDGWLPLLLDLLAEPREVVAGEGLTEVRVLQIKEKFGGLRVYTSHAHPRVEAALRRAEERAAATCEVCGEAGRLRIDRAHRRTLCDRHGDTERTEPG